MEPFETIRDERRDSSERIAALSGVASPCVPSGERSASAVS
jgi:hypothetical protein